MDEGDWSGDWGGEFDFQASTAEASPAKTGGDSWVDLFKYGIDGALAYERQSDAHDLQERRLSQPYDGYLRNEDGGYAVRGRPSARGVAGLAVSPTVLILAAAAVVVVLLLRR